MTEQELTTDAQKHFDAGVVEGMNLALRLVDDLLETGYDHDEVVQRLGRQIHRQETERAWARDRQALQTGAG